VNRLFFFGGGGGGRGFEASNKIMFMAVLVARSYLNTQINLPLFTHAITVDPRPNQNLSFTPALRLNRVG
jgi:hypothetical protein